jgi:6-phosphogluconate dehydrogenase
MVHNGIEYGLMQAYAEGFDIMRHAGDEQLPVGQRYDLTLAGHVQDSGEGRWTIEAAIAEAVPVEVLASAATSSELRAASSRSRDTP